MRRLVELQAGHCSCSPMPGLARRRFRPGQQCRTIMLAQGERAQFDPLSTFDTETPTRRVWNINLP